MMGERMVLQESLTASSLMRDMRIPTDWQDQHRALASLQQP
jgi:hypothetical protein